MRGITIRFGVVFLCCVLLASPVGAFGASTVTINILPPGGSAHYPVPLLPGEVAAGMTTPISNLPTSFSTPDTVLAMLDGSSTVITSDDNAGTDAGATPASGSAARYLATGSVSNQWRVTGLGALDAGQYTFTRTVFTPGVANPGDFNEVEPNNTVATTNIFAIPSGAALLVHGSIIVPADQDYFATSLNAGDILSAMTIPLSSLPTNFSAVNTVLTVFDASGLDLIVSNNDAGSDAVGAAAVTPARGSVIRYQAASAGLVHLRMNSFAAGNIGNYALLVSRIVPGSFVLNGDYNKDLTVDAADYVVWRKQDRTLDGYDTWRANFGSTVGSASDSSGGMAVPEPKSLALVLVSVLGLVYRVIGKTRRRLISHSHVRSIKNPWFVGFPMR